MINLKIQCNLYINNALFCQQYIYGMCTDMSTQNTSARMKPWSLIEAAVLSSYQRLTTYIRSQPLYILFILVCTFTFVVHYKTSYVSVRSYLKPVKF